ncbi:MAG: acetylxylan esterase [Phycisphaerae bacterium]|nr:acetylxylan esterase [Phycisphaerae bacterium]
MIILLLCSAEGRAWEANYDESKIPKYTLPDPLTMADGTKVDSPGQWRATRRGEILDLFKTHVYGAMPPAMNIAHVDRHSFIDNALGGKARLLQESIYFKEDRSGPKIDICIFLPPKSKNVKAYPAFLALNFFGNHTINADPNIRMYTGHARLKPGRNGRGTKWPIEDIVGRGYAVVTACYNDFDIDHRIQGPKFDDGVHQLYPKYQGRSDNWTSIGAWAWGMSRILDYLEDLEYVDAKRVVAMGHSRLGKTALWAGATDERFALVISNNSGCGGAALARRRIGESVWRINTSFPHWFCAKHKEYNDNENAMPVDQHMLIAMIAPRPVYVASAIGDKWADPRGEFLACVGADPVYKLLNTSGLPSHSWPEIEKPLIGRMNYHVRKGKHDVIPYDWKHYLDFADRYLKLNPNTDNKSSHPTRIVR